jgi:uncharacterized OB-fold protein
MQAIEYWRHNKTWAKDLGKKGKVLAATEVFVGAEEQEKQLPYFYVLVDFGKERKTMMAALGENLRAGDEVEVVFRKLAESTPEAIIHYGLKVRKCS